MVCPRPQWGEQQSFSSGPKFSGLWAGLRGSFGGALFIKCLSHHPQRQPPSPLQVFAVQFLGLVEVPQLLGDRMADHLFIRQVVLCILPILGAFLIFDFAIFKGVSFFFSISVLKSTGESIQCFFVEVFLPPHLCQFFFDVV